jgi:hypothetical protein
MTHETNGPDGLEALAARASNDPFFLGSLLAEHQRRQGLNDGALAAALGCAPDVLARLRLCRRPGAAGPSRTAGEDVEEVARHFGIDAGALRRIVEEGAG